MSNQTVTVRRRVVQRNKADGLFYVYAARSDGRLGKTGRGYENLTSAMARLGRLVQVDTEAADK